MDSGIPINRCMTQKSSCGAYIEKCDALKMDATGAIISMASFGVFQLRKWVNQML
jgi:hypothetical protein